MTSSPVAVLRGGAATLTEETREDNPQDMSDAKLGAMNEEPSALSQSGGTVGDGGHLRYERHSP